MIRPLLIALVATTALLGCNRLNPGTWLNAGADTPRPDGAVVVAPAEETRALVQQVTEVDVQRTDRGAIVRATGVTPTQGWYQPGLVAQPVTADGVLTLEFRVAAPEGQQPVGPTSTREVVAAAALDAGQFAQARRIIVRGETNALVR